MVELKQKAALIEEYHQARHAVSDMTMTTDTSFVERPATKPSKTPSQRGGTQRGRGRGSMRGRGR